MIQSLDFTFGQKSIQIGRNSGYTVRGNLYSGETTDSRWGAYSTKHSHKTKICPKCGRQMSLYKNKFYICDRCRKVIYHD